MYQLKDNKGTTLIDTGANCSCISRGLVNKLNLVPIDIVNISTPSNQAIVNVYVLNIKTLL